MPVPHLLSFPVFTQTQRMRHELQRLLAQVHPDLGMQWFASQWLNKFHVAADQSGAPIFAGLSTVMPC